LLAANCLLLIKGPLNPPRGTLAFLLFEKTFHTIYRQNPFITA
jgi:hypothetical protein